MKRARVSRQPERPQGATTVVRRIPDHSLLVVLVVMAIPVSVAFWNGHVVIGLALLGPAIVVSMVVAWEAEHRKLRRVLRHAHATLPAASGPVTIVGTVVSAIAPLVAPHSKRGCVAYWERSMVEFDGGWKTVNESSVSVDFVLRCGDVVIMVEGLGATMIFDMSSATHTVSQDNLAATDEVVFQPGDRLVVAGRLVHGVLDGPFHAAARIERSGKARVELWLVDGPVFRRLVEAFDREQST